MRWLTRTMLYRSLAAAALISTTTVIVASELSDAIHSCAQEPNDARRLACYDNAAGRKQLPTAPPLAATPAVRTAPATSNASATPAARHPAAPAKAADIIATVAHVARRADGRYVITLSDGQVWMEAETKERFSVNEGDTVTIRTEFLGSHYLRTSTGADARVTLLP